MFVPGGDGGALAAVLVRDYTGDNNNNREIDLGDDYDEILIVPTTAFQVNTNHAIFAWAFGDAHGVLNNLNTSVARHSSGSYADDKFQGKVAGTTKIKLASVGSNAYGCNASGVGYRIIAKKYAMVRS